MKNIILMSLILYKNVEARSSELKISSIKTKAFTFPSGELAVSHRKVGSFKAFLKTTQLLKTQII